MNKGCLIALIVCAVLAALAGVAVFYGGKKALGFAQSSALFVIEESIRNFSKASPDAIPAESTNKAWTAVLKGTDHDDIKFEGQSLKMEIDDFIKNGEMMDMLQQTPITFQKNADGSISAILPGKDGQIGTADDITSASFVGLINMGKKK